MKPLWNLMAEFYPPVPSLDCYREYDDPPQIVAGRPGRDWMDATAQRFAYRCTPLPMANSSGWEIVLPVSFAVNWTGGILTSDLTIRSLDGDPKLGQIAASVFGNGILTFHPGYLFRTSPGWAIVARGAPNTVKDGIVALEGLVETDWLPFTFTMNWRMTRPGSVTFAKGESFCFLTVVPHAILDEIQPRIRSFAEAVELKASYDTWRNNRFEFQARVARGDPEAIRLGWQRDYVRGQDPSGRFDPIFHMSRRHLKDPA